MTTHRPYDPRLLFGRERRAGQGKTAALLLAAALLAVGCSEDDPTAPPPATPDPVGTIRTVVGIPGTGGFNGDNVSLTTAQLHVPQNVAIAPTGLMVVSDVENQRLRSCNLANDRITTLVGTGVAGNPTPGPALQCPLNDPVGITWDAQERMVFTVVHSEVVMRLNINGDVETIAGTGTGGFNGDGGPATSAELDHPMSVAYDPSDNLFILDLGNGRIRKVDTAGNISTYVGIGGQGYAGDGGAMAAAQFNFPHGQSPRLTLVPPEHEATGRGASKHSYARLYIADTGNHRVRMINMSAETIALVAGNGTAGYAGDGGSPLAAQLNLPTAAVVGPDDSIYIADTGNHVVRRVDALGVISTVAGTGTAGFGGDGGLATAAQLNTPMGLFVDAAGKYLYIADSENHAIRRVLLQ